MAPPIRARPSQESTRCIGTAAKYTRNLVGENLIGTCEAVSIGRPLIMRKERRGGTVEETNIKWVLPERDRKTHGIIGQ